MPEKETTSWLPTMLPWLSTLALSFWAGLVQYIQKVRSGQKWKWRELVFDLCICSFVGIITHLICLSAHIEGNTMSVMIAVSAHMGTRAIASMERMRNRMFGQPPEDSGNG